MPTGKKSSVSCRVPELDDEKAFSEANLPTTLHYAIGIPAHIRKKPGLYHVNTAVKADRDTSFIFKKSINEADRADPPDALFGQSV